MSLSPHLRAALVLTGGAAAFVLILVTRLIGSMMEDPNFGRGDNPFELVSLLACVLGPLLALGAAMGLAFQLKWAHRIGSIAAGVLVLAALSIFITKAIAGAGEERQTPELESALSIAGVASFAGGIGTWLLLRRLRKP